MSRCATLQFSIGDIINKLTVVGFVTERIQGHVQYQFQCECGQVRTIRGTYVRSGKTRSCGCLRGETYAKPVRNTSTYRCWVDMKTRCYNKNSSAYHYYGNRGIEVCDRWRNSFKNFLEDMGEKPDGLTIERINNDLGYSPDNCKWATRYDQIHNRRGSNGKSVC